MHIRNDLNLRARLLSGLLALALLAAVVPPLYAIQQVSIRINHTLAANQDVLDFRVSPDGGHIVYRIARTLPPIQDNPPPPADLFSVPTSGGAAVQINPTATQTAENVESYQFSPDGSEVIYLRTTSDATLGNLFELFRVPVDGSTASVSVSGPIPVGTRSTRDFKFTFEQVAVQIGIGDGSVRTINSTIHHQAVPERIASISDGSSNTFFFGEQVNNLLQFPDDGSVRQINPGLANGGVVYDFQITPDGTRAIYRADQNLDGTIELFSVPADGSDAGFRISGPLVAGGDVLEFEVNANSTRAVYRADQSTNGVVELYSARSNGGIVAKLNAPLTSGGAVTQFELSPDGALVVYLADQNVDGQFDLFTVSSAGATAATLLSRGLSGIGVRAFSLSPDGSKVFFVDSFGFNGSLSLFSRPLALGLTLLAPLPGPPVANIAVPDLKFSADGSRLVYLADAGNDGVFELASIPLPGSFAVTPQINAPLVAGGNIRAFQISPDGQRVVYAADQNTPGVVELFSVPIDGGTVEQISGPLVAGGSVGRGPLDFQFSPDSRTLYYLADQNTDGVTELYAAFDAPTLAFTQSGYVVTEDGSLASQLAVLRSGNLAAPSSVRVGLIGQPDGGTATGGASLGNPGVDFVDNARDVAFASGEISKTFAVAIKNDDVPEAAEDFSMQLFEPVQASISAPDAVKVVILDTANSPLLSDSSFTLPENSPNGTQASPLRAALLGAGMDASAVTTYTILSGNTNNAFRVDAAGALIVNNSAALDYETTPSLVLVVEARADNGSSDVATWAVALQDQNEPPIFASQVRSVAENSPNGRLVGSKLAASDPDSAPITFTTSSAIFGISAVGQLSVKESSSLDFETQTQHTFNVTVADSKGLSQVASIQVNVLDVAEGDATVPLILALKPSSVVAGGKSFKLAVSGKNFTQNSVVRWNGSNRSTVLDNDLLIALISSQDIAAITTAKVDVLDTKTGKSAASEAFPVTKGVVGIVVLLIEPGGVEQSAVGQTTVFNLEWTHTTEPWRSMDEMDLRLVDGEQIPLWVRYQETRDENGADISTIFLLNPDGTPAGSGRFGEAKVLENATVRLDLAQASFQGSGDTGSNIRVRIPVVFKSAAVQSSPYAIEMYGVDDLGGEQGPNLMGVWTVTNPVVYLPQLQR